MTSDEADRSRTTGSQGDQELGSRWRSPRRAALVATLGATVLFFLLQLGWSYLEDGSVDEDSLLSRAGGALIFGVLWGSFMWFVVWRRAGIREVPNQGRTEP